MNKKIKITLGAIIALIIIAVGTYAINPTLFRGFLPYGERMESMVEVSPGHELRLTCPPLNPGVHFIKEGGVFVHFMYKKDEIRYYGDVNFAKSMGKKYITLEENCWDKVYQPKDVKMPISVYSKVTKKNINGAYAVMYTYQFENVDSRNSSTSGRYRIINYEIKKTEPADKPGTCGLTSGFRAEFDVALGQIVTFDGYKKYQNAENAAQAKVNTISTFGYPYKNFGVPLKALIQTEFMNPSTWVYFGGSPSTSVGISTPHSD